MLCRQALFAVLAIVGILLRCPAQETQASDVLTIDVTVDREKAAFGERFLLTVVRTFPTDWIVDPIEREVGAVDLRETKREVSVEYGRTREVISLEARAYALGRLSIELRVRARGPNGKVSDVASTPREIDVAPTLTTAELRDIEYDATPLALPLDRRRLLLWGVAALAIAALSIVFYRLRRRRASARRLVTIDAAAVAIERLAEMRGTLSATEPDAFFSAGTDILRTFIAQATGIRAPEMTTEEFLGSDVVGRRFSADIREALGQFLSLGDRVKFGRSPTHDADRRNWLHQADAIVRKIADPSIAPDQAFGMT